MTLKEAIARVIDPNEGPAAQRKADRILHVLAEYGFPGPRDAERYRMIERALGRPAPPVERWGERS